MEIGRRFGNQVGDAIAFTTPDIRGDNTGQGFSVAGITPPTAWRGHTLAYLNSRRVGSFEVDPFFVPAVANRRVFLEFFLAGPANGGEDVRRYLRSLPGDRVEIDFARAHIDQKRFRIYHTAGLTSAPDTLLVDLALEDQATPTGSVTAAAFHWVSRSLAAGGHSFQVRPLDAAGNEKTGCQVLTTVLAPWPMPPTGVEVHAYSAPAGLVTLKWSKASDDITGDLYNVYRNASTGAPVSYGTAVKSATSPVAVTGTPSKSYATFSLPVTGTAAAGQWLFGVRHQRSSIEEDNVSALARFAISDRGAWAPGGLPYPPSYLAVLQKPSGRLMVELKHDNVGEPARTLRFRLYRSAGAAVYFDPAYFDPAYFLNVAASVDYSTSVGAIARGHQRRFFYGTAGFAGLTEGLVYRFAARSEATGFLRESNTASAANTPDATPPTSCPNSMSLTKVIG